MKVCNMQCGSVNSSWVRNYLWTILLLPHPVGSVVTVSDSWPGGCEFDPRLKPLASAEAWEKVVGGFGKKSSVWTGVRKRGNTLSHRLPWYDLSWWGGVKPQYNQPSKSLWCSFNLLYRTFNPLISISDWALLKVHQILYSYSIVYQINCVKET